MPSINAKLVAHDVQESIRKHQKVNMSKIIKERGYSESVAKRAVLVTQTQSFQEEIKPFLDHLIIERERARKSLTTKISKAKYRDLVDAIDKFTKNIQLLGGHPTENVQVFSWKE